MSRVPKKALNRGALVKLERLQTLARAKSDQELARLAAVSQSMNRLRSALETLHDTEEPLAPVGDAATQAQVPTDNPRIDPAILRARLAHLRWSEAQRTRLNQQLALVTADFYRLHPAAAQAFGRAQVLDELRGKIRTQLARDRANAKK